MIFHVLNRGNGRQSIFEDNGDYAALERVMWETVLLAPMRILAWCAMPNHWHMVLWPKEDGQLARFLQRLTLTHVRRWHEHRHSTGQGHLYQERYKSFPIQQDEHFLWVIRYVERNALRAGLVSRAEQWRWSSLWHRVSRTELAGQILSEWPVDAPRDYVVWVNEAQTDAELSAIRACVARGRPYGQEFWQLRTAERLGLQSTFRDRGRPHKT